MSNILQGFKSEEKQVFENVPVLKFIGNEKVVVFFEGRPEVAEIAGQFEEYLSPMGPDEWVRNAHYGKVDMYHINVYPGFTAKVTKERLTKSYEYRDVYLDKMVTETETVWILTATDIRYERPRMCDGTFDNVCSRVIRCAYCGSLFEGQGNQEFCSESCENSYYDKVD